MSEQVNVTLAGAIKNTRIIWMAMLSSQLAFAMIPAIVPAPESAGAQGDMFTYMFAAIALGTLIASQAIPRIKFHEPYSKGKLVKDEKAGLAYSTSYILGLALAEFSSSLGVVLHFMQDKKVVPYMFIGLAAVGILLLFPRSPQRPAGV